MYVVTEGSGSGKSAYAEDLIMKLKTDSKDSQLIYLATMLPYGEETQKKIERHKKLRAGKGFKTVECFGELKKLTWHENDILLLECMSNLLADEIYEVKSEAPAEEIMAGIKCICDNAKHLVVVTNEVFSDGVMYDEETLKYIEILAEINCSMAETADEVTEVVCGIPVRIK